MKNKHELYRVVYDHYADTIRYGLYREGDSLPTIEKIGEQFNISVNTARQSLICLEKDGYVRLTRGRPAIVTVSYSDEECRQRYIDHLTARHDALEELRAFLPEIFASTLFHALYFMNKKDAERLTDQLTQVRLEDSLPFFHIFRFILSSLKNPLLESLHLDASMFTHLSQKRMSALGLPYDLGTSALILNAFSQLSDLKAKEDIAAMCQTCRELCTLLSKQIGRLNQAVSEQFGENPEQQPFEWHIHAGRPQVYYNVAVQIISEVHKGVYENGEFLPTPTVLARTYGVSLISIRRTITLLNSVGLTETLNGCGTRINLNRKPLDSLELSGPGTRKSLLFYLMGLRLITITCRTVAREVFEEIPPERIEKILACYEDESKNRRCLSTHGLILKTVFYSHKNPEIRSVFSPLIHITSWGIPLYFVGPSSLPASKEALDTLIALLKSGDKEGFARQLEINTRNILARERQKLIDAGLDDARDIRVPTIENLELAASCIDSSPH